MDSMMIRSVAGRDAITYETTIADSDQVPSYPHPDHGDESSMRSTPKLNGWHRQLDPVKLGILTLTFLASGFATLKGMVKHIGSQINPRRNCAPQKSPLLEIPAELRIMIYDLALQDTLDDMAAQIKSLKGEEITPISRDKLPPFLPSVGALALLQTSRQLRIEGTSALRPLVRAKIEALGEATVIQRNRIWTDGFQTEAFKECMTCYDASLDAGRLFTTLVKLAHPQLFLRGSDSDTAWSKFTLGQKIVAVQNYYRELPREEQDLLDVISSDSSSSHKWGLLVNIIDYGRRSGTGKWPESDMEDK